MAILFISDVHLCVECPAVTNAFLSFLAGPVQTTQALYILGDLFDRWVGDDAVQSEEVPILEALRSVTRRGIPIWLMEGNHDFLYGTNFFTETGCQPIPDPHIVNLFGTPTVLTHGDLLCTEDHSYQRFRAKVRDPVWQAEQLAKPVAERLLFAKYLQEQSHIHTASIQSKSVLEVSQTAVENSLLTHEVYQLIHGHTHRPAIHPFSLNNQPARRIVLPDWHSENPTPWLSSDSF